MSEHANLPKEKRTSLGLYVTAVEAYERWKAAPDAVVILDVRTPEEFVFVGHPTMAWNVPLLLSTHGVDAAKRQLRMAPTPDFVALVKQVAGPDDVILATCRSGGRGAMAADILAKAGFTKVYNIVDGVEGDTIEDPDSVFHGKRMRNGWKNAGLPWTCDLDPAKVRLPAT